MADYDDDSPGLSADEKIVAEAKRRFKRESEREAIARERFVEDLKFCEGDSDNNYQWDHSTRNRRLNAAGGPRPCLTINKTRQHCLQIVNDARQNKAQIEVRPVGDGATYEAAKIYEGVVRHIEYRSNAQAAYDTATWYQVVGGIGYLRVLTEYEDDDSLDQEIRIMRVKDPLSVYVDNDAKQYDKSDAEYGFVFEDMTKDAFKAEYPEWKDKVGFEPFNGDDGPKMLGPDDWEGKDHIRVAEYYRKVRKEDKLGVTQAGPMRRSDGPEAYDAAKEMGQIIRERPTSKVTVEWYKIAGNELIERGTVPGTFIPIVAVIGEETTINGKLDRKGHARALKDPQRMYNFWSSSAAELLALQSKSPWLVPIDAVEGYESEWNNANNENKPYIPYRQFDEQGREIRAPQRQAGPEMTPAYTQLMQLTQNEMMMTTGQFQAQFGENENAKSGIAIQTRQRQGDNATYHYIDHLAQGIKAVGRILIQWIPVVYDTPRVIKIMAEDGDQSEVHVDPNAPAPQMQVGPGGQPLNPQQVQQMQAEAEQADKIKTIFNPNVGKYDVEADIGPAYATRRQETFNALSQLMSQNKELMQIAGDLLFRAADFPMADELAERFKRAIPANILGQGPPPELQQAMQQNQALHQIVQQLSQKLGEADSKVKKGVDDSEIKVYDAETRRLAAVNQIDQEALKPIVRELVSQVLGTPILPIMDAHAEADQARMPQEAPETVQ
jgi:hypothetical protein